MFARFLAVILVAFGLSACAPQVTQHQLSPDTLASIGVSSVKASAAPSGNISWPVRPYEPNTVQPKHTQEETLGAVEHAYRQEFRGALSGKQKATLVIQVTGIGIMTEEERAAQVVVTGVLGGPIAMATIAVTPMKVAMIANVSLIDDRTNTVLASSAISTVMSQEGKTDPGPALFRQNAIDARNWLLTAKR